MKEDEVQDADLGTESYVTKWAAWPSIRAKLMSGATLADVAKWLRESEPEARDKTETALVKVLSRMRSALRKTEAQVKLAELQSKAADAADKPEGSEKTAVYVDVLESVMELFTLQMDRIKMGRALEEKVKYLITKLTADIGEAREILKFMFEVQQELGIAKRRPLSLEDKYGKLNPEQRQRVGKVLDLIRRKIAQKDAEDARIKSVAGEVVEAELEDESSDIVDMSKDTTAIAPTPGDLEPVALSCMSVDTSVDPNAPLPARMADEPLVCIPAVEPLSQKPAPKSDLPWEE